MKNASMNRQSLVSIFTEMLLAFNILGILFSSLFLVSCGGDEEADNTVSPVSADDKKGVPPVAEVPPEPPPWLEPPQPEPPPWLEPPQPEPPPWLEPPQPEPPPWLEPPLNDLKACAAGMTLKPGESCSYVAGKANVVFSVLQDGSACREGGPVEKVEEVFGVKVNVNIENQNICRNNDIERDDAFKSNFAASKNPDGSWTINSLP